eukprot:scaffold54380_cov44-Prasinocladus_malaysianus.AAC.1
MIRHDASGPPNQVSRRPDSTLYENRMVMPDFVRGYSAKRVARPRKDSSTESESTNSQPLFPLVRFEATAPSEPRVVEILLDVERPCRRRDSRCLK